MLLRPSPIGLLRACALGLLLASSPALAADYYVATNGNDSNPGTLSQPFATFSKAATTIGPGDTVWIRGGTYAQKIFVVEDGEDGAPIVWRAYPGETPTISNTLTCISLHQRSYVVIDGITCDGGDPAAASVENGLAMANGSYHEVRNSTFRNLGNVGIDAFSGSHHNRFENNLIENIGVHPGGEGIRINQGAHHNLVANNTLINAGHNLVFVWNAHDNVIRRNIFSNAWWRAAAVFGDEAVHNLFDENQFLDTNAVNPSFPYPPAINVAAPETIIRRNLFVDSHWDGIEFFANTDSGEVRIDRNRVYNNVVYRSASTAVRVTEDGAGPAQTDSLIFVNNVLYKSGVHLSSGSDIGSIQIDYTLESPDPLDGSLFHHNLIRDTGSGETVIKVDGLVQSNLAWYQTNRPQNFHSNLEVSPGFVNESARDFTLANGSALIDAGDFLTEAVDDGAGKWMPVEDSLFFHAGGEVVGGDWIQLEGGTAMAQVCSVDYDTHQLGLDRQLSWSAGQGIALLYNGSAPDIGAFEKNLPQQALGTPCITRSGRSCGLLGAEALLLAGPLLLRRRSRRGLGSA